MKTIISKQNKHFLYKQFEYLVRHAKSLHWKRTYILQILQSMCLLAIRKSTLNTWKHTTSQSTMFKITIYCSNSVGRLPHDSLPTALAPKSHQTHLVLRVYDIQNIQSYYGRPTSCRAYDSLSYDAIRILWSYLTRNRISLMHLYYTILCIM